MMGAGTYTRLDLRADPLLWAGTYDQLEVWRSRLTEAGPFEEITGPSYMPARLPRGAGDEGVFEAGPLINATGLDLQLLVDEQFPVAVVLTGTDPLLLSAVAAQVQTAGQGLLHSYVYAGRFVVETTHAGLGASLRVVGGAAAPLLGLSAAAPLDLALGRDGRVGLLPNVELYKFADPNGDPAYTYKTRFRNYLTGATSVLSPPLRQGSGVDAAQVVRGFVRLTDFTGRPLANWNVLLQNTFNGTVVEGTVVAGGSQDKNTDATGYVEFLLVRGLAVTVAIAGTNLVRDAVVPTDPAVQSFNLLDPSLGSNDLFQVQVPALDSAARRSLG